jgi:hypothetical protein
MLGAFQVVGFFVNYINDKLQGERAQEALRQAASEITKWQATTRGDGALISISYVRKDFNDPTGVVKRSSFIQASDTFYSMEIYSMEIDYGPTD